MRFIKISFAVCLLLCASSFLIFMIINPPATKKLVKFGSLEMGTPINRVFEIVGEKPENIYYCKGYKVFYFSPPRSFFFKSNSLPFREGGNQLDSFSEMPDVYGYFQLVFNSDGILIASTRIGETTAVTTIFGLKSGSHVRVLDQILQEENIDDRPK